MYISEFTGLPIGGGTLTHYGIKGMKWGVRRTPEQLGHPSGGTGQKRLTGRKLKKAQRKYDKTVGSAQAYVKVQNAVADRMNGPDGLIAKFNKEMNRKLGAAKANLDNPAYVSAYNELWGKTYAEEVLKIYGDRPS